MVSSNVLCTDTIVKLLFQVFLKVSKMTRVSWDTGGLRGVYYVPVLLLISSSWILCCHSYLVDSNPYRHVESLDPEGKFVLEWMVDWDNKRVVFNVTVETTGYIGLGLSSAGKMSGADIIMGGVLSNGKPYFSDRHAIGNQIPVEDESQDWTLLAAWESGTHTFLSFSRLFDTCDKEDYPITEDVISLIWSYGENDNIEYHFQHRGHANVFLLDPDLVPRISQPNYRSSHPKELGDLKVWSVHKLESLPPKETFYTCTFHKAPRAPSKQHIVGFNTVFHSELERRHVHHFIVYRCHAPAGRDAAGFFEKFVRNRGQECYTHETPGGKIPALNCREPIHVWSVGGKAVFLPEHVGIPMSESSNEYYMIQAHYENGALTPGIRLRYSLEFFYTNTLRKHDAGLMIIGHKTPGSPSLLIPPSSLGHVIYGQCGSGCTKQMLPSKGIQIFATSFHTHTAGRGVRLLHIRKNEELPWVAFDDNYKHYFQQIRILRKERTVLPGDQLITRCLYETAGKGYATVGGPSLRHELCVGGIWYYNKIPGYGLCDSEIKSEVYMGKLGISNATWSDLHLEMIVNSPKSLSGLTLSEVTSRHVKWTIARRTQLQEDHRYLPQINECPRLIPGMPVNTPRAAATESPKTPTLQRYIPKGEKSTQTTLKDSEYVSIFPKDVVPYERAASCVRQPTRQVVQQTVTDYQNPSRGTWWSINTNSQGYTGN